MDRLNKARVLCGTMLVGSTLGFSLFFGNLSTYVYSVFLSRPRQLSGDLDPAWMYAIFLAFNVIATLAVDLVRKTCGLSFTAVLGLVIYCSSFFLTYFAVKHSVWATSLSFMALGGFGAGVVEVVTFCYMAGWFKENTGLASGLVLASNAIGGVVINPLVTAFINPEYYSPDSSKNKITYFSQPDICDRVPIMFIVLGTGITVLNVTGFLFMKAPPNPIKNLRTRSEETQSEGNSEAQNNTGRLYTNEIGLHPNENTNDVPLVSSNFFPEAISGKEELENNEIRSEIVLDDAIANFDSEQESKTPSQVLKSEQFYYVTFSSMALDLSLLIVVNYHKLFGQIWIEDDGFLALTSSVASSLVIVFRIVCGFMVDKAGVKNTLIAHAASCSVLLSLWYFSAMLGKWPYLIWTCNLMSLANNKFILYPLVVLKLFGQSSYATNLGLIQLASLIVFFGGPYLVTFTLSSLGWFWLFFIGAAVSFIVEILIVLRM